MGIAAGYGAHYLDKVYPSQNNGKRLLPTPAFLVNLFPAPSGGTVGGGAPVPPPNSAINQPSTRASWGTGGNRLGSE